MFMTLLGQIAPDAPPPLPMVALEDDESLRKALERKPGCSSFVSLPAATRTDGRRGPACTTGVGFSSFAVSLCPSLTDSFLLKGFDNSTFGLGCGDGTSGL